MEVGVYSFWTFQFSLLLVHTRVRHLGVYFSHRLCVFIFFGNFDKWRTFAVAGEN